MVAPCVPVTSPSKLPENEVAVVAVAAFPPMFNAEAVPVMLVPTKVDGVPKFGVTKVGDVDKTTFPEPVAVVTPVPPLATGSVPVTFAAGKPVNPDPLPEKLVAVTVPEIIVFPFLYTTKALLLAESLVPFPIENKRSVP